MKTIIHKVLAAIGILLILKAGIDLGLWMMNYPTDITFFLGLCLNIISIFWGMRSLVILSRPEYKSPKEFFNLKD